MSQLDVGIVSGCDRIRYASYIGHQLYARKHGLAYHLELAPFDGAEGYWHKVAALRQRLASHDWVVWFDDDAFITDLESTFVRDTVERAHQDGAWLAIAPSVDDELNGAWAAYNTGVFALRNCSESHHLLASVAHAPMDTIERQWDSERLGVFTHGDQDALVWFVEGGGHHEGVHWVDPLRWNARPWNYSSNVTDAPVCHFPGHPDKTLAIAEFALRMGTDESLVRPRSTSLRRPTLHSQVPSTGPWGVRLRQASLTIRQLTKRVALKIAWVRETRSWS